LALIVAASGCSIKEVQLWFQVHQKTVTSDQVKSITDLVNSQRTPGCDPFYTANPTTNASGTVTSATPTACVPDNVASVHCAGSTGDGPAVEGPLKVGAYDPFDLDKDGDKAACVDPVGSIDVLGQVLTDQIHLAGWAFDPNTTDPIHLSVTDNGGTPTDITADGPRADINAAFNGVGTTHGYDQLMTPTAGATHRICATAKNTGAGTDTSLGCKTITLQDVGDNQTAGHEVIGLIEGADRVPGGIHVRGFAFDQSVPGTLPSVSYGVAETPTVVTGLSTSQQVVRPDVVTAFSTANLVSGTKYGFDFLLPVAASSSDATTVAPQNICLYDSTVSGTNTQLMCRSVDS
jgi:hypothetical protein